MKILIQRLLIFIISVPLVVIIILFLPQFNHLAFNVLAVIFSILGAVEFSAMLGNKKTTVHRAEAAVLGALLPAAMTISVCFNVKELLVPAAIAAAVLWLLVSGILSRNEALASFIDRLVAGFAVLIYPGFLVTWLIHMSRWENASVIILAFVCTVFASDSSAWAIGMLFGRGNQGIIPASPNKSVAGFIGAAVGPIIIGIGAVAVRPDVFIPRCDLSAAPFLAGALLGLLTGAAAAFGDLAESAIKRSSGMKDSGRLIPGRGGALDCVDSVAFAAPVFYLVFSLLFASS